MMTIERRQLLGAAAATGLALLPQRRACAQAQIIRVGVLNDQSGPYRDTTGMGSAICAQLALSEGGCSLVRS
jgi:branched-chain amino acid transport system substrate-binding protein